MGSRGCLEASFSKRADNTLYYTRKVRYFVQFLDFVPEIRDVEGNEIAPSELKTILLSTSQDRDAAIALLNSGLFYWFFCAYSDVRNVNRREISAFPCELKRMDKAVSADLQALTKELMRSYKENARLITSDYGKYGTLTIQSFQPRASKDVLDRIDCILARHYGLTDEELDFIINYDIKYRMGQDSSEGEEE